jgi:23S rRNA (adenine2503-C2)-methyltransferase
MGAFRERRRDAAGPAGGDAGVPLGSRVVREQLLPRTMPHMFGMLPEDLAAHLRACGVEVRDAEARRIVAHAIAHGREGHPVARPVPRAVESAVDQHVDRRRLEIIERATDPSDGFVKYLFRMQDGALAEAVRIPLEVEGRFTVCLSSQAGCAMGCDFCATGRLGLTRNLEPWEIVAQFVAVRDEAPGVVTGAVFQGQGEPLHNYDNVIRAAEILSHPCGGRISAKAITISTVGLVPAIHRFAKEGHPYRLIVSLTSAIDERRRALLPVASKWSVRELADAVRAYQRAAGGRVTIAWVVMGGVNTGAEEVDALRELFDGVPLRINLIDVNVPSEGRSAGHQDPDDRDRGRDLRTGAGARTVYRRATDPELDALRDALRTLGVPVVRRYSGGAAKHAACGMLAAMQG